ncbi:lytic transglycosylase domain-containing protein [Gaoshiqia sp. Z1-71]|uniref:lytic transglycosylase domain-containing protein n=1 Tax=Gaoshiqia hydrogeniformans TaxID=3290090 RepID=UPI003BF7F36A
MMRKALILLMILSLNAGLVFGEKAVKDPIKQVKRIEVVELDTLGYQSVFVNPDENLNDLFGEQIDSLLNSWYIQNTFALDISNEAIEGASSIVSLPDSVYISRLQSIDSFIDLSFNKTVKNFIELYTHRKRELTEVMLGLSAYYFPMFEELLDKHEMPMELKYLPIIESALNPVARSRANAVGLWQFMYGTGRMYKLEIGTFIDERRDPEKSSEAAVKYLKDLYKIYNNWHLVIAAYNCGPGNVNKAIRRSGGARDYWTIYYNLPRETRGYVPAFIAAAYVMNHYQQHGLQPRYPDFPIATDTLHVTDYLHFNQVASILEVPVEALQSLNPQYRMNIIPARANKPYTLRIPVEKVSTYIDKEDEIFAYKRHEYFPNNEILVPKEHQHYVTSDVQGKDKVLYTVKSGDNLGYISQWFRVSVANLRYWNNINNNMIRVGQKLAVYVPQGQGDHYASVNSMSLSQKQEFSKKAPVTKATTASANVTYDPSGIVYYTVRKGDTLWSIARQFPGVSNQEIMRLNNMQNANVLKVGQKLKIQPKS